MKQAVAKLAKADTSILNGHSSKPKKFSSMLDYSEALKNCKNLGGG